MGFLEPFLEDFRLLLPPSVAEVELFRTFLERFGEAEAFSLDSASSAAVAASSSPSAIASWILCFLDFLLPFGDFVFLLPFVEDLEESDMDSERLDDLQRGRESKRAREGQEEGNMMDWTCAEKTNESQQVDERELTAWSSRRSEFRSHLPRHPKLRTSSEIYSSWASRRLSSSSSFPHLPVDRIPS